MDPRTFKPDLDLAAVLRWHLEAGVDETIGEGPLNRYVGVAPGILAATTALPTTTSVPRPVVALAPAAVRPTSAHLAQGCKTLDELKAALQAYDGCALKTFATNTVIADGQSNARVMVIGEAPGEDEDRQGLPFVGVSGKLLDRMLASVGLDRTKNVYITNIVFWRPPGNRKPTSDEIVQCLPFVQRQIEILDPALLLLIGGPSASTLLANPQGITKIRGKWLDYKTPGLPRPIPAMATFHPAYLLRSPQQKRLAWRDLLMFRRRFDQLAPV
jgi:uracil-DNA glycosylase